MERKIIVVTQIKEVNGVIQLVIPTPFSVGPINVYLIKGDIITLVDTGPKTKETWQTFCELLNELKIKPDDIGQVVLTHHHPDHVGLLDYLPADVPVIGHWKNGPWLSKNDKFLDEHDAFFMRYFKQLGVDEWMHVPVIENMKKTLTFACSNRKITHEVKEGDTIPGLPAWRVYETPGHAGSHIVLYHEQDGVMIGGDLLIEHTSSNPLVEPPYYGETERVKSLPQYHRSLQKCLGLNVRLVLPGHGKIIENPHELINLRLQKQEERMYRVYEWLKEQPLTAFEISEKLYPTLYKKELGLTLSVAVGQLDLLEEKGVLEIDKTNEVWKYSAR